MLKRTRGYLFHLCYKKIYNESSTAILITAKIKDYRDSGVNLSLNIARITYMCPILIASKSPDNIWTSCIRVYTAILTWLGFISDARIVRALYPLTIISQKRELRSSWHMMLAYDIDLLCKLVIRVFVIKQMLKRGHSTWCTVFCKCSSLNSVDRFNIG